MLTPGDGAVYFARLTVKNIRCFAEEVTLDLCDAEGRPRQWTILLGDNGVGKTTLLQCLALLEPLRGEHPYGQLGPTDSRANYPAVDTINPRRGDNAGDRFIRTGRLATEADTTESRLAVKLLGESKYSTAILWYPESPYGVTLDGYNVAREMQAHELERMKVYAYGAARHLGPSTMQSTEKRDATATLFSPDSGLLDANEWLLRTDYFARLEPEGSYREQFERVKDLLIELLPDVSDIQIKISAGKKPSPASARALDQLVLFETQYGGVPLRELSLGYQSMLAWLVDFAARMFERYPDSEKPLHEPAVVLIDEIDLHLHPRWQRGIIDYLTEAFPKTQFIVTAHSPLVVQAAEDANLVLLRREGDHVVIDNRPEMVHSWRVDQLLTSDLFGLESGRSPRVARLMDERTELLARGVSTDEERQRLAELDEELGVIPAAERREDREALQEMRKLADLLRKQAESGS